MSDGAIAKITLAERRIAEIEMLIRSKPPFSYVVETDMKAMRRATYAKRDEGAIEQVALIAGEAIHALRSALDHAYFQIVSPLASSEAELRRIQFPFVREEARLPELLKTRLADRVSNEFVQALIGLQPHAEANGNRCLYLIEFFDLIDKHRLILPTGDFTEISPGLLQRQIPSLQWWNDENVSFGMSFRDITWSIKAKPNDRGKRVKGAFHLFERTIDVPVKIAFTGPDKTFLPVLSTLKQLASIARQTVQTMRNAVS